MCRYDWPSGPDDRRFRPGRGNATARRAYNLDLNVGSDPGALADARALRHDAGQDPGAAEAAGNAALSALAAGGPAATLARAPAPSTALNPDRDLWLPLGPATTLRGSGDSEPRVAGRVRDIAVSPNGQRAYAASALGGLWYTDTAGARWAPVGAWAMVANPADLAASSHTLTCGSVHVVFDPGNDAALDEVWLATGEPGRYHTAPFDIGIRGPYGGVGILHALGPVAQTVADPWTRQAQPRAAAAPAPAYPGLRGAGVYRLAPDPANAQHLVAATTRGLHHNGSGQTDPWGLVTVAAWEALFAGISATVAVTDAAWTPATGAHPARLWVSVVHETPAGITGVWFSQNGVAGPFTRVALPGVVNAAGSPEVWRLGFAAHPSAPDVLYVLGSGPWLWRIDGTTPNAVSGVPTSLFTAAARTDRDQSDYDLAVAVDPANANRVLVGGSGITSPISGDNAACLYRLTLGAAPPPTTDYAGGEASDPTWVGAEVHADIHRIWWGRVGVSGHVWVCCDGGVFRSVADAQLGSFVSRSTGLSVTEAGFLATHPQSDGVLLAGVQDNGVQLRIGESVWRRALVLGDGGGVAFHPGEPGRFVGQYIRAQWYDDEGDDLGPASQGLASPAFDIENEQSRFYSNAAAVIRHPSGVTQLAVGTTRVWYSEQWGFSQQDPITGLFTRQWVTLPGGVNPRSGNANDTTTDLVPPGPQPFPAEHARYARGVRALRWSGPDRLYVLMQGALYRLDRTPATGTWTRMTVVTRPAPPVVIPPLMWPSAAVTLPFIGSLNDLAVHIPSAGPHGSLYLATSHPLEPIWWFNGTGEWHPARLGTQPSAPPAGTPPPLRAGGVRAPAYAVVVDPDDHSIVYVGTTVGVWRGVLTLTAGTPSWTWAPFYSGLPEAAVQDLVLDTWPRPAGPSLKLLRAALQSRGVWEVEPGADAAPTTFLRVHPYDTRRVTPTDVRNPLWHLSHPEREWPLDWADRRNRDFQNSAAWPVAAPDGTPVGSFFWHASPDIRLRPAPGPGPAIPPPTGVGGLPWTTEPDDRFWLWSLQTALRSLDPHIVPDGRWTPWFARRLAGLRVALGIDPAPGLSRVDAALWNRPSVQAAFWSDPWADGGPTEADLIERVVGMATPRLGGAAARALKPASLAALARAYRVEVCMHHRGREAPAATDFAVILLRARLPASPAGWAGMPALTLTAAARTAVRTALDALPAAGGTLPSALTLPTGWSAVDSTVAVRRPIQPAVNGAPAVVTFNASFPVAQRGTQWVFVALAHSRADPLALAGANLRAMVLESRHAAARSVHVV